MFLVGGILDVLRGIAFTLCEWIYPLIPQLYSVFYDLAAGRFFNSEIVKDFSTNIYVLISVVMLFAFAVKLLQAIVNPDLLLDSKKGVLGVLKRALIALFLIIIIPFSFNMIYELQDHIISNSLIEKLIVGIQTSDRNIAESTNAGQVLAATTLSGLLYPEEGATTTSDVLQSNYNTMINEDISYLSKVSSNINEKFVDTNGNDEYVLHFDALIAIIAGIFVVYMFILFCFDTAFRMIKLAFLELTAPVSIMAYIYNGDEFLNKWFKETLGTFVGLFIRVAALGLLIFALHRLPTFMDEFDGNYKFWVQLFIIVGILMFVKAAPDLVKTITGVTWKGGGISRRLGEMAAVGAIAQNAWKGLGKNALGLATTAVGAGFAAAGTGVKAGARAIDNNFFNGKGRNLIDKIKSTSGMQALAGAGSTIKAGANAGGGFKSISAASKAWKDTDFAKRSANRILLQNAAADKRRLGDLYGEYGLNSDGNVAKGTSDAARIKANDKISRGLSGVSTAGREAIINKGNMDMVKSSIDNINKKKDDIVSNLDTVISNSRDTVVQQALENFKGEIKNNASLNIENTAKTVQDFVDNGTLSTYMGAELLKGLTAIQNTKVKLDADVSKLNIDDSKITNLADGNRNEINMKAIVGAVSAAEAISTKAQGEVDKLKESSSEYGKKQIDEALGVLEKINKQGVFDHNSSDSIKYELEGNIDSTSRVNNNTSSVHLTPTENGEYRTDGGIILPSGVADSMISQGSSSGNTVNSQPNVGNNFSHNEPTYTSPTVDNSDILKEFDNLKKNQDTIISGQNDIKKSQQNISNNQDDIQRGQRTMTRNQENNADKAEKDFDRVNDNIRRLIDDDPDKEDKE